MEKIVSYFFKIRNQPKEVAWFQMALYLFLLYKSIVYLVHFNELFSSQSLIAHRSFFVFFYIDAAFLLNNYNSEIACIAAIVLLSVLSMAGIAKKTGYILKFIVWLLMVNIHYFLYPTLSAGDYLLNQLLFFNIFLSGKTVANSLLNDVSTAFHNTALLAVKIQICMAYMLAGWFKLTDNSWLQGMALSQIFEIADYSHCILQNLPLWLTMPLTYFTIAYQLLFPVFIWFRPFKLYLLAFGILQHLVIAFGMGLFSFGIIMIICYILFLKYDYYLPADNADFRR